MLHHQHLRTVIFTIRSYTTDSIKPLSLRVSLYVAVTSNIQTFWRIQAIVKIWFHDQIEYFHENTHEYMGKFGTYMDGLR
jgi:hypothetical protein